MNEDLIQYEEEEVIDNGLQEEQEGQEDAEIIEEKKKEESVPLSKFMKEKNYNKELKQKLAELESKLHENDFIKEKERIRKKYVDRGFDDDFAEAQADEEAKTIYELKKIKSEIFGTKVETEIKELAESDSFFSDALAFKSEIKDIMKKKDISAEEAYMLLRGKARAREIKEEIELKNSVKRREVESKKVDNSSTSSSKSSYPLDEHDKKALKGLQEMQPNKGWTAEKYYKLIKNK